MPVSNESARYINIFPYNLKINKIPSWIKLAQSQQKVMIIGGGIAGIQASLDLADRGIIVDLIEKEPCIGGKMAQLDRIYPTDDCAI